jgi:Ca2+-binding EF-hand superfamily protein
VDLRQALQLKLASQNIPLIEWEKYMKGVFDSFDEDGSGTMEVDEFEAMLDKLQVAYKKEDMSVIFEAIATSEGLATFDDFWRVVFPSSRES